MLSQFAMQRINILSKSLQISPSDVVLKYLPETGGREIQLTIGQLSPTSEQKNVINKFKEHCDVVIDARSGTGKSTTLFLCAQASPTDEVGGYIAFNNHTVKDAADKLPEHIKARTLHSIAYEHIGKNYQRRLKNIIASKLLVELYDLSVFSEFINEYAAAGLIKDTLSRFCNSADIKIKSLHVNEESISVFTSEQQTKIKNHLKSFAADLWNEMVSGENNIPVTHEFYLKVFSLQAENLGFDFLLVDECQDMTPAMMAIIDKQECRKVKVGDIYQNIYHWKTEDSFSESVKGGNTTKLTKSFRFGEKIARRANKILKTLDAEPLSLFDVTACIQKPDQDISTSAIICHSSAGLLCEYLDAYFKGTALNITKSRFNIKDFSRSLMSIYHGEQPSHQSIMCHRNWQEFTYWVKSTGSHVYQQLISYIETYSAQRVEAAFAELLSNDSGPELILVSKAKGREWDHVKLGEDFLEEKCTTERMYQRYVAITRAISILT